MKRCLVEMKSKILGLLAVGLLAESAANSAVITYDFTTTVGNGSFSYDNTSTTPVSPPGGDWDLHGSLWYSGLSFIFDGTLYAPPLIGIFNNHSGLYDCMSFTVSAGEPSASFCGATSLWSNRALSNAIGRDGTDFDLTIGTIELDGQFGQATSLTQRLAVPEPGTLALLGLGLLGLGLTRRRRAN